MHSSSDRGRLVSLDVFRGATIVAMILVNNPGSWSAVYAPLRHAEWHGWTPTDLVFPFFLFIVGVAIPLALGKRRAAGASRGALLGKAVRRAATLFGLGLFLHAFPFLENGDAGLELRAGAWERLRIMGVLQRIALCYLAATCAFLFLGPRGRRRLVAGLLLGYWGLLVLVPVPGVGAPDLDDPESTLAAWVDRAVLGEDHLWAGADRRWDPEGLLSTLPAVATTLIGVWAGCLLVARRRPGEGAVDAGLEVAVRLLVWGAVAVAVGTAWGWTFPINKALWTSSYALMTAGHALVVLGVCFWAIDLRGSRWWTRPFVIYGVNALTVFVLSGLLAKTLALWQVERAGESTSLHRAIYESVFLPLASPVNASLLYAVTWILGWFLVLAGMYRRGWIWKV